MLYSTVGSHSIIVPRAALLVKSSEMQKYVTLVVLWALIWLDGWLRRTHHGIAEPVWGAGIGSEGEGRVRGGDGWVGGEVGLHAAHAAHVHARHGTAGGHELGGHAGHGAHLVVVAGHGRGEAVAAPHSHPHPHSPSAIQSGAEEIRHPRPLLLGLRWQLPVPELNKF